jgi:serine/threonine protein phosphatase PrpC
VCVEPARRGATYLLCCDGVYETLDEEEILASIGSDPRRSAEVILRSALRHYAADNISVIVARVARLRPSGTQVECAK